MQLDEFYGSPLFEDEQKKVREEEIEKYGEIFDFIKNDPFVNGNLKKVTYEFKKSIAAKEEIVARDQCNACEDLQDYLLIKIQELRGSPKEHVPFIDNLIRDLDSCRLRLYTMSSLLSDVYKERFEW